jgi:hypothetical protein
MAAHARRPPLSGGQQVAAAAGARRAAGRTLGQAAARSLADLGLGEPAPDEPGAAAWP